MYNVQVVQRSKLQNSLEKSWFSNATGLLRHKRIWTGGYIDLAYQTYVCVTPAK